MSLCVILFVCRLDDGPGHCGCLDDIDVMDCILLAPPTFFHGLVDGSFTFALVRKGSCGGNAINGNKAAAEFRGTHDMDFLSIFPSFFLLLFVYSLAGLLSSLFFVSPCVQEDAASGVTASPLPFYLSSCTIRLI